MEVYFNFKIGDKVQFVCSEADRYITNMSLSPMMVLGRMMNECPGGDLQFKYALRSPANVACITWFWEIELEEWVPPIPKADETTNA